MAGRKLPHDVADDLRARAVNWRRLGCDGAADASPRTLGYDVLLALGACDGTRCPTLAEALEQLADLVDRPECRMDLVETTTTDWGEVHIWECSSCGGTCEETDGSYERCPRCGAIVTEERR